MSKVVIAQNGDRLDQIVYQEYKTLDVFDKVLEANPHLSTKTKLELGDKVTIPIVTIEKTTKSAKKLW
jgi:phage tail protein X